MTSINSPFRYPGGKFYARQLILELIPSNHTYYIEPFAGGGSIFFAKDKKVQNVLNDMDSGLINCYVQIRDNVEGLIDLLNLVPEPPSKELHTYYKTKYKPTNDLERAFRWYYLNRISYSGIMNLQNCYWGYGDDFSMKPDNWPVHLRRCSKKLQGVTLTCQDFAEAIGQVPDGAFLFIDPPYFNGGQRRFYNCIFQKQDHERLVEVLQKHSHRVKFLLTYDDSSEIRQYYQSADWAGQTRIIEKSWNYTLSRTDHQSKKTAKKGKRFGGKEIFILNYNPVDTICHATVNRLEMSHAER